MWQQVKGQAGDDGNGAQKPRDGARAPGESTWNRVKARVFEVRLLQHLEKIEQRMENSAS